MKPYELQFYKAFMRQKGYILKEQAENRDFKFVIFNRDAYGQPWLSISKSDYEFLIAEPDIESCFPESAIYYKISKGG